jgi:hypothetical protein
VCCQGQWRLWDICHKRLGYKNLRQTSLFPIHRKVKDGSIDEYEISELRHKELTQTWYNGYSLPEEHIFHFFRDGAINSEYLVKFSRYLAIFVMSERSIIKWCSGWLPGLYLTLSPVPTIPQVKRKLKQWTLVHITKSISELQYSSRCSNVKFINVQGESQMLQKHVWVRIYMWQKEGLWLTQRVPHSILPADPSPHLTPSDGIGTTEKPLPHSMNRDEYRWCAGNDREVFDRLYSEKHSRQLEAAKPGPAHTKGLLAMEYVFSCFRETGIAQSWGFKNCKTCGGTGINIERLTRWHAYAVN